MKLSFLEAIGGVVIAALALGALFLLSMFVSKDTEDVTMYLTVSSCLLYFVVVILWMFDVPFPRF